MMQLNVNKEMLLKHRFWILLGVSALLSLIGLLYLEFAVDAETERKAPLKVISQAKTVKGDFASPATIAKIEETAKEAQSKESIVWENAYRAQKDLFRWPELVETKYDFAKGRFATDITILPLPPENTWPPDTKVLMHGELVEKSEDWISIRIRKESKDGKENKDGKQNQAAAARQVVKFYLTPQAMMLNIQGETPRLITDLPDVLKKFNNKILLAVTYQVGRYFNDPLTSNERNTFSESYRTQIPELLQIVNPLDDKDNGVVQLKNWRFNNSPNLADWPDEAKDQKFIRYVKDDWKVIKDFSVEAWIAQENIWIQKEIYTRIRAANDSISQFKVEIGLDPKFVSTDTDNKQPANAEAVPAKKAPPGAKAPPVVETPEVKKTTSNFKSKEFDLALSLDERGEVSFRITNLQTKPEKLEYLQFRVLMNNAGDAPETIRLKPGVLQAKGKKVGKEMKDTYEEKFALPPGADKSQRTGIYSVELERPQQWFEEKNKQYIFKNSYFELGLSLDKNGELAVAIKNLQPKRQKLDNLRFRVQMGQGFEPEILSFSSDPLQPKGHKERKDIYETTKSPGKNVTREGIYSVEQVLSWETAAVKRLDLISIGSNDPTEMSHSNRTFPDGLRPLVQDEVKVAPLIVVGPGRPVKGGGGAPLGGVGGLVGGGGGNAGMLEHGLWKNRYSDVSEQSRRIPVCVVMIVDQSHVDRVLTSFNNSKLRFLMTQLALSQYTNSLLPPPLVLEKKDPAGGGNLPNLPVGPGPRGFPRIGPEVGPPGQAPGGGSDVAAESNVELVIYGIVTLYQRYPPLPPTMPKKQ